MASASIASTSCGGLKRRLQGLHRQAMRERLPFPGGQSNAFHPDQCDGTVAALSVEGNQCNAPATHRRSSVGSSPRKCAIAAATTTPAKPMSKRSTSRQTMKRPASSYEARCLRFPNSTLHASLCWLRVTRSALFCHGLRRRGASSSIYHSSPSFPSAAVVCSIFGRYLPASRYLTQRYSIST
jgi:hypothetical protein